jgi:recombinational DNA repair ATPase RecF
MPTIREVCIKNFRSIRLAVLCPGPGLNCLIGPGDSGKSTILDAVDLALGARRYYQFSDADFCQLETDNPIEITITLGNLPEPLLNIDAYGYFLRGRNAATGEISDEPQQGW